MYLYTFYSSFTAYVMFKKRSRGAISDLKHELLAKCYRFGKACTASFSNGFKNEFLHEESLKINVF